MKNVLCDIYRCSKKEGLYLYVARECGLEGLPPELKNLCGRLELATTMLLKPEKKLARASIESVIAALSEQGYYLQMPTQENDYMQAINQHNNKLTP